MQSCHTPGQTLAELARFCQIETGYQDVSGRYHEATVEALLYVLSQLGVPLRGPQEAAAALREQQNHHSQQIMPPVSVMWGHGAISLPVTLPAVLVGRQLAVRLELEDGRVRHYTWRSGEAIRLSPPEAAQKHLITLSLEIAGRLPYGYHRLYLEMAGQFAETCLIVAPRRAYAPSSAEGKTWGVFLPLYALWSERSWGSGNFNDLGDLMAWTGHQGGRVVGTLPFLAAFMDKAEGYSPYTPASRLAWNEYYLDMAALPEFACCPAARAIYGERGFQEDLRVLRNFPLIDYNTGTRLRRRILEATAQYCEENSRGQEELATFAAAHPLAADYAVFRATRETRNQDWPEWPGPLREGKLGSGDYEEKAFRYHLYAQMRAQQQIEAVAARGQDNQVRLYLDMPLGVHPAGYDVWRHQGIYLPDVSVGAPPDAIFSGGQNWNFPPLHPGRLRQQRYEYYRACLRHQMRYAGVLRLDHVMGLHRLFWIPRGMTACEGIYVRYPAAEFYAILSLESWRHRCLVLGEDLGTVPPDVRPAMAERGIFRMYVLQYEFNQGKGQPLGPVAAPAVAALNTHDMPPWAAFWAGRDLVTRTGLGLLSNVAAALEYRRRLSLQETLVGYLQRRGRTAPGNKGAVFLDSVLAFLGRSRARLVLVNLEDLWGETQAQNVPGTGVAYGNWRHRARYSLEYFTTLSRVTDRLKGLRRARPREGFPNK
jgi:4-alpha-glucanotransferase